MSAATADINWALELVERYIMKLIAEGYRVDVSVNLLERRVQIYVR
jgi:hypothetical protein